MKFLFLVINVFAVVSCKRVMRCSESLGSSVVRIIVQLDPMSLASMRGWVNQNIGSDFNYMSGPMGYFRDIFDQINMDLQKYGVQIHGDFTKMDFSRYIPYEDPQICLNESPEIIMNSLGTTAVKAKDINKFGVRLLTVFCPDKSIRPSKNIVIPNGPCRSMATLSYGIEPTMAEAIKKNVHLLLTSNKYSNDDGTTGYNDALCDYVSRCISQEKSDIGEFVPQLKSVRHVSTERYIFKPGEKIKEADLNDDIFLLKAENYDDKITPSESSAIEAD